MLRVLDCVLFEHDIRLVLLAGLICLVACATAVQLLGRARAAEARSRDGWIVATGVVTGCGVWATHFVAMLAYRSPLPLSYDVTLTLVSIVAAVGIATAGIFVFLRGQMPLLGGAIVGGAIATMHFVGMAALLGPIDLSWDPTAVAASLVLGIGLSAASFRMASRAHTAAANALTAGVLVLAICTLHFTAMSAITLKLVPGAGSIGAAVEPMSLAVAIAAVAALIIGLGLAGSLVDQHLSTRDRSEAQRLRIHVAELEGARATLERTSRDLASALEAANQSSQAKSRFLASMSHELRTPLNAIIGYADLMQMEIYGSVGDRRYIDYLGHIHSSGSHLLALICDILDTARLEAKRFELYVDAVDLDGVIREALGAVAPQAAKAKITLHRDVPAGLPKLRADRRRLLQILLNLLSNSLKFTPEGGSVRVSASCDGQGMVVSVVDTGIGMAAKDIPVALSNFGQIDSAQARLHEGTGLGLPLTSQLVQLHGGEMVIASELGRGTTVKVILPCARPSHEPGRAANVPAPPVAA